MSFAASSAAASSSTGKPEGLWSEVYKPRCQAELVEEKIDKTLK